MGSLVSMLAFPAPPKEISQAVLLQRVTKNQFVYLTTQSGFRIPAIHIRRGGGDNRNDGKFTLIYSHGNAEDVGLSLPYLDYLQDICDCNVLAYEYCGYSIAEGEPSEQNCNECIQAAYDYLVNSPSDGDGKNDNNSNNNRQYPPVDPSKIVLFGRSLGTGTGVITELCGHIIVFDCG
jgi:hypothetical protein